MGRGCLAWLAGGGDDENSEDEGDAAPPMQIGPPLDVHHVTHVTFDRFKGFLGLPEDIQSAEFVRRAPSAGQQVFGVRPETMQCAYDDCGNSVPQILLELQGRLYEQSGLETEGIFRVAAANEHEDEVRAQLNAGLVPQGIDVHALAGLIKAWFRELPEGVLDSLKPEVLAAASSEEQMVELVGCLPPMQSSLLDWVVNLMADVVESEAKNKMNAHNIAMVFAPNMTQVLDPILGLRHAVKVMELLRVLIRRKQDERQRAATLMAQASLFDDSDYDTDRETLAAFRADSGAPTLGAVAAASTSGDQTDARQHHRGVRGRTPLRVAALPKAVVPRGVSATESLDAILETGEPSGGSSVKLGDSGTPSTLDALSEHSLVGDVPIPPTGAANAALAPEDQAGAPAATLGVQGAAPSSGEGWQQERPWTSPSGAASSSSGFDPLAGRPATSGRSRDSSPGVSDAREQHQRGGVGPTTGNQAASLSHEGRPLTAPQGPAADGGSVRTRHRGVGKSNLGGREAGVHPPRTQADSGSGPVASHAAPFSPAPRGARGIRLIDARLDRAWEEAGEQEPGAGARHPRSTAGGEPHAPDGSEEGSPPLSLPAGVAETRGALGNQTDPCAFARQLDGEAPAGAGSKASFSGAHVESGPAAESRSPERRDGGGLSVRRSRSRKGAGAEGRSVPHIQSPVPQTS